MNHGSFSSPLPSQYLDDIHLLLPLDLFGNGKNILALVADRDDERKIYRIRTALPAYIAYGNARVVRRLDNTWLKPRAA